MPIIPGIKPLTTKRQLSLLPQRFFIDLPEDLVKEALKCKDDKAVRELGIEFCIEQSKDLISKSAPVIHYYSMSKMNTLQKIVSKVF